MLVDLYIAVQSGQIMDMEGIGTDITIINTVIHTTITQGYLFHIITIPINIISTVIPIITVCTIRTCIKSWQAIQMA